MGTNIISKTIEEKNIQSNEPNFDEKCENIKKLLLQNRIRNNKY